MTKLCKLSQQQTSYDCGIIVSVMDVHLRDKHNGGSYLSGLGHHTQLLAVEYL